jgi:hypothetical protein
MAIVLTRKDRVMLVVQLVGGSSVIYKRITVWNVSSEESS